MMEMSQTTNWEIARSEPIPITNTSKPIEVMDGVERRFRQMLAENEREKKLQQTIALEKQESKAGTNNAPQYTFDFQGVKVPIQTIDQNVLIQVVAPVNSLISRMQPSKDIAAGAAGSAQPKDGTSKGKGFFQTSKKNAQPQSASTAGQPVGTTNYQRFVKKIFKEYSSKVDRHSEVTNIQGAMCIDF